MPEQVPSTNMYEYLVTRLVFATAVFDAHRRVRKAIDMSARNSVVESNSLAGTNRRVIQSCSTALEPGAIDATM